MKNQYVADVGDYGKISLLKAFSDSGIKVGINWYHTSDDGTGDGKHTSYLEKSDDMKKYCPNVFEKLKTIIATDRSITALEKARILKNAVYFNELMDFSGSYSEKMNQRVEWASKAERKLQSAELIFLDPDNGLLTSNNKKRRNTEKYVLPEEIVSLYENHNVLYYCHKGRRKEEVWEEYKATMFYSLPCAVPYIVTFHKGTQRSFVFLIHPVDAKRYIGIINNFVSGWDELFTEEKVSISNILDIKRFAEKWVNRFKTEKCFDNIFNDITFSEGAEKCRFIMDSGNAANELFGDISRWFDIRYIKRIRDKSNVTVLLLGEMIYSRWRYINHWSETAPTESDREWFMYMLEWMEQLCEV